MPAKVVNVRKVLNLLAAAMDLADQAITLADAYAGGDSENCEALKKKYSALEKKVENGCN